MSLYTMPELLLGLGIVIIPLFLQYWLQISRSLRSFFPKVSRCGALPLILCVFLVFLFAFPSVYLSFNSVNFRQSRPLARLNFFWFILKWTFLLYIYAIIHVIPPESCRRLLDFNPISHTPVRATLPPTF